MKKDWWIGCSGFHYKPWRGVFYPQEIPVKKWFDFYCQHFNTVELNVTFYRFPEVSFLKSWFERSPDEFRFAVKAPRAITHYKKFIDSADLLSNFYDVVNKGLKDKLGCILYQLPPSMQYTDEKLEHIISCVDPAMPNVIEFRHSSWWNQKVMKVLEKSNITFCGISHPWLPKDVVINNPLVYYRFHGTKELYKTPYTENELKKIAEEISKNKKARVVYCYFNNDIDVNAPRDAALLNRIIAGA